MKIKKVNELRASEYPEEELIKFRENRLSVDDVKYNIYGESLKYSLPEYNKLQTFYKIEDVYNWYKVEISNKFSRIHKYENVILVKETSKSEIVDDLKLLINSDKYNL